MRKMAHIFYSGMVQGVGFRFACERIAGAFGLVGWAANLGDGRVEVVIEGEEADIIAMMGRLKSLFASHIRDIDVEWGEPAGEFAAFEIRVE